MSDETEDLFAGLHIYYIPTDRDQQLIARHPEGMERHRLEEMAVRRRVGYVLGRSGDNVVWTLDDCNYSDAEHGQFAVHRASVSSFFSMLRQESMQLMLPQVQLVSRNALAACIRPSDENEEN